MLLHVIHKYCKAKALPVFLKFRKLDGTDEEGTAGLGEKRNKEAPLVRNPKP